MNTIRSFDSKSVYRSMGDEKPIEKPQDEESTEKPKDGEYGFARLNEHRSWEVVVFVEKTGRWYSPPVAEKVRKDSLCDAKKVRRDSLPSS
ncbi:MAG TPA: hypothetical protein VJH63_02460 [Candidatus Paceibacterota bacterium]